MEQWFKKTHDFRHMNLVSLHVLLKHADSELNHVTEALLHLHGSGKNEFEPPIVLHYRIRTHLEPDFSKKFLFHGRNCLTDVGRSFSEKE